MECGGSLLGHSVWKIFDSKTHLEERFSRVLSARAGRFAHFGKAQEESDDSLVTRVGSTLTLSGFFLSIGALPK